jgi:hypothetical protein
MQQRDGLVVAHDREVERAAARISILLPKRVQALHRDAGLGRDRDNRGGRISVAQEEPGRGLDDPTPGLTAASLVCTPTPSRRCGLSCD